MASSKWTGPLVSLGPIAGAAPGMQPQEMSSELGTSILYNGFAIPDPRQPGQKDNPNLGALQAVLANSKILVMDGTPAAAGATVASGAAVTGAPLALTTTAAAGVMPNVDGSVSLDVSWDQAACTAANPIITPASGLAGKFRYVRGQWLVLSGAGIGGRTMVTQVIDPLQGDLPTQVRVNPAPYTTVAASYVATGAAFNPNQYGATPPGRASSRFAAGFAQLLDPETAFARAVNTTGGAILITGTDLYGMPQTELIAASGRKTWKTIVSAVPQFTGTATVVTTDIFGFPIRIDTTRPELIELYIAGALEQPPTGMVAPDFTNPATQATGDPRGTFTSAGGRIVLFQCARSAAMASRMAAPFWGVTPA